MKARAFRYLRPDTLEETLEALSSHGDAEVLAGGQSLLAALNLRLAAPECLVDINRVPDLGAIEMDGDVVVVKSLVRHAAVARSTTIAHRVPLVKLAIAHVAHPAVRNRGTTCGSLAYADPASEMPACSVALDATIVLISKRGGRREVRAREFYRGIYETARRDEELVLEVRLPPAKPNEFFAFEEIARRHGDFALVGVAVRGWLGLRKVKKLDIVVFGSEPKPMLSTRAASTAQGEELSPALIAELAETVAADCEAMNCADGEQRVRRHQAKALVQRTLSQIMEQADA